MKSLFKKIDNVSVLFWASSVVLLFVLFLFLQPKIAASLFYERRLEKLGEFITAIKETNEVNPREYWEFREFYMPGTALFRKDGIMPNQLPTEFIQILPKDANVYLFFESEKILSVDGLGSNSSFSSIKEALSKLNDAKIITMSNTHILISIGNSYYLSFIKPRDTLNDTTGIFQYWAVSKDDDDSDWLNLTRIDL